jgi:TRAP transporter 4TM/12TM fusion protein
MLYYLSLFIQGDLEAAKLNLRGLPASELPRLRETLRKGWVFLLPFAILIYLLMVENFPASVSGIAASLATLVFAQIVGTSRFGLRGVAELLRRTGRAMLGIVVVCALAGIVIGALSLSGILFKMTLILSSLTFGHPIVLLAIVAAICVVLGMGLPSIVIYVLLSVLIAPALVEFGIPKISAHLFIYYFGMLSMITPPICLAVFAAMSISNSKLWPTGLAGMRLGIVAYIVPFVFALNPALVMEGDATGIVLAIASCGLGVYFLSVGCAGYIFGRLAAPLRAVFILAGLAMMPTPDSMALVLSNTIGLAMGVCLMTILWARNRRIHLLQ